MKNKFEHALITMLLLTVHYSVNGQAPDTLTLDYCQKAAIENYPLTKGKKLLISANKTKTEILNTNYLPRFNLNSQATYQSDVPEISLDLPGVQLPSPPKDRYDINIEISQTLFAGRVTKNLKELEIMNLSVDTLKIEVDLYTLREKVNTIFFGILILQENEKLLNMISSELGKKISMAESGVRNGILVVSDLDLLRVEKLKIDQQKDETTLQRYASIEMLGKYLNQPFPSEIFFKKPAYSEKEEINNRPEIKLFDTQINKIEQSIEVLNSKRQPKIGAFVQTGYGQPGLNMLAENFNAYYLAGVKLTWNIFDWNQTHKEKQVLKNNQEIIDNQKETFNKNIDIALTNLDASVRRLSNLIETDKEIIELRSEITKKYSSQLENGVISASDYITQLIAETQARIKQQIHEIQLLQEQHNIQFIKGN